jgi:hypothetical protein
VFHTIQPVPGKAENIKVFLVLTHGSECHSKCLKQLLRVKLIGFGMTEESDTHIIYTFLSHIVTMSDGEGRSVTVSIKVVD